MLLITAIPRLALSHGLISDLQHKRLILISMAHDLLADDGVSIRVDGFDDDFVPGLRAGLRVTFFLFLKRRSLHHDCMIRYRKVFA